MSIDERKDSDTQNKASNKDEDVKDLSSKKLDEEKEAQVKGGFRSRDTALET